MDPLEKAVRDASVALRNAITAAEAAGFRVDFPRHAAQLEAIAISTTARNAPPAEKPAKAKADDKAAPATAAAKES